MPQDESTCRIVDGIARLDTGTEPSLARISKQVKETIRVLAGANIDKLLVDTRTTSVSELTLSERYAIVTDWARVGRGKVQVAVLLRPEFIDPENVGSALASRHGFSLKSFVDEPAAIAWLKGMHA